MSLFKSRKKFTVSERDPTYKVKYLGNVQTSMMRGDGCVDKPTGILWNNYMKTASGGLDMKLTVCASGLKAITREQGLTEYRAHRISYCIAHPKYPRLFVWVYRHEGKRLKVELRCHAVLCKTEEKAKAMAVQLHDKLAFALSEFMRDKCRRQNTRLTLQRTNSLPLSSSVGTSGLNARNKFLSTAANFKPPVDRSASAPKLGCIAEDFEPEEVVEEEEEEVEDQDDYAELDDDYMLVMTSSARRRKRGSNVTPPPDRISEEDSEEEEGNRNGEEEDEQAEDSAIVDLGDDVFNLEVGNDVEALKMERGVQYQLAHIESDEADDDEEEDDGDDSSESGFSEQDTRESSSNGSGGSAFGSDPHLAASGSSLGGGHQPLRTAGQKVSPPTLHRPVNDAQPPRHHPVERSASIATSTVRTAAVKTKGEDDVLNSSSQTSCQCATTTTTTTTTTSTTTTKSTTRTTTPTTTTPTKIDSAAVAAAPDDMRVTYSPDISLPPAGALTSVGDGGRSGGQSGLPPPKAHRVSSTAATAADYKPVIVNQRRL